MKKIIASIFFLLPIMAIGSINLFQTSEDPAGKYRVVENGDGMYEIHFCPYTSSSGSKSAMVWCDAPGHYIFGARDKEDILTQLLAIMSENWDISEVELSFHYEGSERVWYNFVSLYCSDIGIKMNNDEHFQGKTLESVSDVCAVQFWKFQYQKSFKMPVK